MARKVTEEAVCDFCGKPAAHTFTVSSEAEVAVVDLCESHSAPFLKGLDLGSKTPRRQAQSHRPRPAAHAVVPID